MKDWFNIQDMKVAMLETLFEMKQESTITDFCVALIEKFEKKEENDA